MGTGKDNLNTTTNPSRKLDRTISVTLFVLFLTACIITATSHNLLNKDLKQKSEKENTTTALLSVPKPRIREPAKGGLPPIPDFVKKKTAGEYFVGDGLHTFLIEFSQIIYCAC